MPLAADSPQMTSTTPFDPATATIAIVTYNRSGLLTRLLESIVADGPEARARRDHRQRVGRRHHRGRRVVPRPARHRARLPPPRDQHRRLRRLQRGHARRLRARLDVDVAHGRRRRGASPTASPAWARGRRGSRASRAAATTTTAASSTGSTASPSRSASRSRSRPPASTSPASSEMNSGCFEGMFIHRDIVAADRPARPALLHLLGRPDVRLARLAQDDLGHRERVRAAPHARDQAVGHGHPPHERLEQRVPVLHHAQPRPHEALLPVARRLPAGAVRRSARR